MKKTLVSRMTLAAPARPHAARRRLGALALTALGLLGFGLLTLSLAPRAKSAGGAVPVSIVNAPLPVSDVSSAAHTPITLSTQVAVPNNQYKASILLYTVPSGKRLVIQSLNALSTMDVVQNGVQDITIVTITGGNSFDFNYPATEVTSYNWLTAGTTLVYADPGTQVSVVLNLAQKTSSPYAYSNIALVGYLENA